MKFLQMNAVNKTFTKQEYLFYVTIFCKKQNNLPLPTFIRVPDIFLQNYTP
jgi:hypothetical protein